jgi:hypothetical protein
MSACHLVLVMLQNGRSGHTRGDMDESVFSFAVGDTSFELVGFSDTSAAEFRQGLEGRVLLDQPLKITTVCDVRIDRPVGMAGGKFQGGVFYQAGEPVIEAALFQKTKATIGLLRSEPSATLFHLDEAVYGGLLPNRYGHVILEALARLWAVEDLPDLPILFQCVHPPKPEHVIFKLVDALGIARERLVFENRSGSVGRLHIPESGLVLQNNVNLNYKNFLEKRLRPIQSPASTDHLYLSRMGISDRHAVDEVLIEQAFEAGGYRPERLETLSIVDQISRIGAVSKLAGFIGSQFHNLLFRERERPIDVLYICGSVVSSAYPIIDLLTPGHKIYASAAHHAPYAPLDPTTPFRTDLSILRAGAARSGVDFPPVSDVDHEAQEAAYRRLWCKNVAERLGNWYVLEIRAKKAKGPRWVLEMLEPILTKTGIHPPADELESFAEGVVASATSDRDFTASTEALQKLMANQPPARA